MTEQSPAPISEGSEFARRFKFNENVVHALADGLSPEDWRATQGEGNSIRWLVAHLTLTRREIARKLGADVAVDDWEPTVDAGTDGRVDGVPEPDALLSDFRALGEILATQLVEKSAADYADAFPGRLPDRATTWAGYVNFMLFHETYHVGQIALLRRIAGKPGLV